MGRRLLLLPALLLLATCSSEPDGPPPNVLWIVWDTVRADRMSLYGHDRATTPRLDAWAEGARVFENCVSTASSTVPSHASMFTGLLPTEHGMSNRHLWLEDEHRTVAEVFGAAGYRTFLWAQNPHVSKEENFQQGFDVERHPWDPDLQARTIGILRKKLAPSPGSELAERLASGRPDTWTVKAAGELAETVLTEWLGTRGPDDAPYFAFLNYMEAHRPLIPPRKYRELFLDADDVERSFDLDFAWVPMWAYTFGLREYEPGELDLLAAVYDASLAELDDLLGDLLDTLEASGHLDNTIVVLTADHGELLGEHHMLDHQYNLYSPVLRVPLVVHWPGHVEPGRDARPVMNFDLFPTLLSLANLEAPDGGRHAQSLLDPSDERARLSEYPSAFETPIQSVAQTRPGWNPSPWRQELRALHMGPHKLILWEDGRRELYDVDGDPLETADLAADDAERADGLEARLKALAEGLRLRVRTSGELPEMSGEAKSALDDLGYTGR
ncbi:MAG: sulfatase [Planctomycetota bacterium]